jgi:hypothetical protein
VALHLPLLLLVTTQPVWGHKLVLPAGCTGLQPAVDCKVLTALLGLLLLLLLLLTPSLLV